MQFATNHLSFLGRVVLCSLLLLAIGQVGTAQSSNFSTPTAEVLSEKEIYLEAHFDAKLTKFRDGGWQSYGFLSVLGIGNKVEVGLNAYFVRSASGNEPLELQPNIKFQAHNNEDRGTSLAVGAIGYIPLKRDFNQSSMASIYVMGSKKFKSAWTPKFSGGAYQLVGARRDGGSTRGFLVAVEQPIHSRVTLIADWTTGKNRFGYAAAGLGVAVTKRSYLSSAYYFGNEGRGNNFVGIYYGSSF